MLTKFKTRTYSINIEPVEVEKETEHFVYIPTVSHSNKKPSPSRREGKISEYSSYHDSWEDAHNFLMKRATDKVTSARVDLARANGELGNVKGMKKPEAA